MGLPFILRQLGLVVEGLEVGGAAGHAEKNDAFGPGREVQRVDGAGPGGEAAGPAGRGAGGEQVPIEQRGERGGTEADARPGSGKFADGFVRAGRSWRWSCGLLVSRDGFVEVEQGPGDGKPGGEFGPVQSGRAFCESNGKRLRRVGFLTFEIREM